MKTVFDYGIVSAIVLLVAFLLASWLNPRDDTDPENASGRSGMELKTDSLTGCQYLVAPLAGIIRRTDKQGTHLGCK